MSQPTNHTNIFGNIKHVSSHQPVILTFFRWACAPWWKSSSLTAHWLSICRHWLSINNVLIMHWSKCNRIMLIDCSIWTLYTLSMGYNNQPINPSSYHPLVTKQRCQGSLVNDPGRMCPSRWASRCSGGEPRNRRERSASCNQAARHAPKTGPGVTDRLLLTDRTRLAWKWWKTWE